MVGVSEYRIWCCATRKKFTKCATSKEWRGKARDSTTATLSFSLFTSASFDANKTSQKVQLETALLSMGCYNHTHLSSYLGDCAEFATDIKCDCTTIDKLDDWTLSRGNFWTLALFNAMGMLNLVDKNRH